MHQAHTFIRTSSAGLYSAFGVVLLSLTIALSGCSEDPSGGSGFADLARGEPTIVDSVLAISVFDDRPDGITNRFSAEFNDQVYLWILWANITEEHTVEVRWYSPDDGIDDPPSWEEKQTFTSTTGDKITWFYIDLPDPDITGEWFVEVYLDGDLFERSHIFWVE
ncbi:hypothetical protein C6503_01420 [Candidatus Poribacteria bacterium]|nr:MAG: hypothetical protein C6503_01420 [Candidatus Poribacteria bacterium]